MQRISLDSSASKLHGFGGRKDDETYDIDDLKPVSSSPSSSADFDDHKLKDFKPHRVSSPFAPPNQKFVHFIPILTLICFIILYLTSHAPSQSESDENGDDISSIIRSDTLAIRSSVRNLQETDSSTSNSLSRRRTSHRKTADF